VTARAPVRKVVRRSAGLLKGSNRTVPRSVAAASPFFVSAVNGRMGEKMRIVDRRRGGYLVECGCERGAAFHAERLLLTIECPYCGENRQAADLVAAWVTDAGGAPRLEAAD
jgi:hypothetical protein